MDSKKYIIYTLFLCFACKSNIIYPYDTRTISTEAAKKYCSDTNPYGSINEIPLPAGFTRIKRARYTFGEWLLGVKLKKDKTVYQFNGIPKRNQTAQFAVLDISVGDKDLQQCADAVMRLRAEYLFSIKDYRSIHFTDNAGTVYKFSAPYTNKNFHQYLQKVFGACGSASLAKQLGPVSFKEIEPGNVIIRGGFPGHAVIVIDVAVNKDGIKIYELAQSYMPAQDIHVLVNPANKILSPWYQVSNDKIIETPEYDFTTAELKRW